MKTFEYKGFDAEGYSKKGLIEALDTKDAREKLSRMGVLAERLVAAGSRDGRSRMGSRGGVSSESWSLLYRELAALLGAGLPVTRALEVLIQSPEHAETQSVLAGIRDKVREGASLADALSVAGRAIRPFEKAVIQVGEKSATLDVVLDRLAGFLDEQEQLKERVRSALIYPAIVLTFALCVAVVMLGFMLPSVVRMLQDSNVTLPLLTRFMMKAGRAMLYAIPAAVGMGLVSAAYLGGRIRRNPDLRLAIDRRLFRLPVFGKGYGLLVNLRFARTLGILRRGGVSVIESLTLAGKATGSPWVVHQLVSEAESVRHGSSIADAIRRVSPLSSSLPGWIQVGEASGALENLLDRAGDRYQHQWNTFVARCLSLMEPSLILLVGTVVLLVALSILLPVMSLNRAVT